MQKMRWFGVVRGDETTTFLHVSLPNIHYWKSFENRLSFDRDINMSMASPFLWNTNACAEVIEQIGVDVASTSAVH